MLRTPVTSNAAFNDPLKNVVFFAAHMKAFKHHPLALNTVSWRGFRQPPLRPDLPNGDLHIISQPDELEKWRMLAWTIPQGLLWSCNYVCTVDHFGDERQYF